MENIIDVLPVYGEIKVFITNRMQHTLQHILQHTLQHSLQVPVRAWAPKYMNGPPSNTKSSLPIWICTWPSTIRVKWWAGLPRSYRIRLQFGSERLTLTMTSCLRRRRITFSDMTRRENCNTAVWHVIQNITVQQGLPKSSLQAKSGLQRPRVPSIRPTAARQF